MKRVLEGSHAVAEAVRLAKVQVISAYPITPQTHIVEILSEYCTKGLMNARFLRVESEHSCMAALIGAQTAGVRTFTATSGQGLALMHELLHWASGARLPIVMAEVNRALAPGWNIWVDQTDSLAQRDTGWIQMYCEDGQEVLDSTLQAFYLAETVNLPVMIVLDAFYLSHTYEPVASQMVALSKARIYFKVGTGLLPFEDRFASALEEMNGNISVVDSSAGVEYIAVDGDHAPAVGYHTDPHVWLSVRNAERMKRRAGRRKRAPAA